MIPIFLFLAVFSIGSAFGCQNFCVNCTITQMNPHNTGSTVISFSSRTGDNTDACGNVTRVIIDNDDIGSNVLLSIMLSAFMAGKEFGTVRTCGCKDEWGTNWPKVGWVTINP